MVTLKYRSLDSLFYSVKTDKIILNDYDVDTTDKIETLRTSLMSIYTSDTISLTPRCECGELTGEYLKGETCHACGTKVIGIHDSKSPFIWFRALARNMRFISPQFWLSFNASVGGSLDTLRWMTDSQYNPPITSKVTNRTIAVIGGIGGFKRSYPWVVRNMRKIIVVLRGALKKDDLKDLLIVFDSNREKIFSRYLPISNKRMFIVESVAKLKYTNLKILDVLDAVLSFISSVRKDVSNKRLGITTSRTCAKLAAIYKDSLTTFLNKKRGIPRKHINGFRSYYTGRSVIVPIVDKPSHYTTIELPWSVCVVSLRSHLLNKLLRMKYSYTEAINLLYSHVNRYNQTINDLFDILIDESPYDGIPCLINRNPSLLNGSTQTVLAVIKRVPSDKTIGIPILITKAPNADFDGDQMNIQFLLDTYLYDMFKPMEPHASVADMSSPGSVSGRLTITDMVVSTISNYMHHEKVRLDTQ